MGKALASENTEPAMDRLVRRRDAVAEQIEMHSEPALERMRVRLLGKKRREPALAAAMRRLEKRHNLLLCWLGFLEDAVQQIAAADIVGDMVEDVAVTTRALKEARLPTLAEFEHLSGQYEDAVAQLRGLTEEMQTGQLAQQSDDLFSARAEDKVHDKLGLEATDEEWARWGGDEGAVPVAAAAPPLPSVATPLGDEAVRQRRKDMQQLLAS